MFNLPYSRVGICLTHETQEFIRKDDEHFTVELQLATTGGTGTVNVSPLEHERRLSSDSTTVNFDTDPDPPPYELPAHEIMLDGIEPDESPDLEMMERSHDPLISHMEGPTQRKSSNATMIDTEHVEGSGQSADDEQVQDLMDTKGSF